MLLLETFSCYKQTLSLCSGAFPLIPLGSFQCMFLIVIALICDFLFVILCLFYVKSYVV